MCIMMLHLFDFNSGTGCILRGKIFRMQVADNADRLRIVQSFEIPNYRSESLQRLPRFKIAYMLTDKNIFSDFQRYRIF